MASGNPQRLRHTAKEEGAEEFTLQNSLYKMSHVISLFLSFLIFKTETFPTASCQDYGNTAMGLEKSKHSGNCVHITIALEEIRSIWELSHGQTG